MVLDFWKIIKYFDKEEENFNNICRHGLSSSTNKESLLAYCLPNATGKKLHYFSFPLIKEEKWFIGAKTKYDIPQYIEGIPDGFAIFCTTWEAGKIRKYQEQQQLIKDNYERMKEKEVEDMDIMNKRLAERAINKNRDENKKNSEESEKDELEEPIPRNNNKFCHICYLKYDNYLNHIKSFEHFNNFKRHTSEFTRFKNTFERIINFWNIKRTENKNNNNNINSEMPLANDISNKNEKSLGCKSEENSMKVEINNPNENNSIDMKSIIINNNKTENLNNICNASKQANNNILINQSHNINEATKENISNNIKVEENPENNISSNINIHSFNLTCSTDNKTNINSIININNINNTCINTNNIKNTKDNNKFIINKEENKSEKKLYKIFKEEKDIIEPAQNFETNSEPLVPIYKKFLGQKKKRYGPEKTLDIFEVNTPKRIRNDYFPFLSIDNPKKLINNCLLFFK